MAEKTETLERGDIYFFYRPKVNETEPEGVEDVQRFYLVLHPEDKQRYRLIVIGRKRLADPEASGRERVWGFVDLVRKDPQSIRDELSDKTYQTKTRGERRLPAGRPAGEGVYRIVRHDDHTHLAYALELPKPSKEGEVQDALQIEPEASYIINVKNPAKGSPPSAGLGPEQSADYPKHLIERFRDRRFAELDPPDFLNHEGAEFVLVASSSDVKEDLDIELQTESEDKYTADVFNDLKIDRGTHPTEPLLTGEWA